MAQPLFITTEKNNDAPHQRILIIDKKGILGKALVTELSQTASVVYVSRTESSNNENTLWIPYRRRVPFIPNYYFHYQFVVLQEKTEAYDLLPDVLTKARAEKAHVVIIFHYSLLTSKEIDTIKNRYADVSLVLVGDVFPLNPFSGVTTSVERILAQAARKKIVLSDNGIKTSHPVSFLDVVDGILTVVFSSHNKAKLFLLLPQEAVTDLSIARALLKQQPDIRVDFSLRGASLSRPLVPVTAGEYLLPKHYPLAQKLSVAETVEPDMVITPEGTNSLFRSLWQIVGSLLLFIVFLVLIPLLVSLSSAGIGMWQLHAAKTALLNGQIQPAGQHAQTAAFSLGIASSATTILHTELSLVGLQSVVAPWKNYMDMGKELSIATADSLQAIAGIRSMLLGEKTYTKAQFVAMLHTLKNSYQTVEKEKLSLSPTDPASQLLGNELIRYEQFFSLVTGFNSVLPDVLGFNDEKRYLVLLQNNMELRPGGGFIGSYALLTINNGKVIDFAIHDVYDADGQLKGHIEPPFAIRRYLPSAHWYLRDSNFSIDFPESAKAAAKLYTEEMGEKIDGVIGVDVSFMQQLVKALGKVEVPDYNETVTADNFYEKTQSHVEKNFFPGSTQKKDFLNALFRAIQLQFETRKDIPYAALLDSVLEAVAQKHIIVAFADTTTQQLANAHTLSSSLLDTRPQSEYQINDFLSIVDANLGSNKANYFVSKTISQHVGISESGQITEEVSIAYTNNSKPNTWPGGEYKNYVRLVVPEGSVLQNIEIDGVKQQLVSAIIDPAIYERRNFVAPKGLEVETVTASAKTSFGFLVIVPPEKSKTVKVTYTLARKIAALPVVLYSLRVFKQPGTLEDPYSFSLQHASARQLLDVESVDISSTLIKKTSSAVSFKIPLHQDLDIAFRFSQTLPAAEKR